MGNYINATVGFRQLAEATSLPANSLMRMFGPNGNPSAKNLFGVLAHLGLAGCESAAARGRVRLNLPFQTGDNVYRVSHDGYHPTGRRTTDC